MCIQGSISWWRHAGGLQYALICPDRILAAAQSIPTGMLPPCCTSYDDETLHSCSTPENAGQERNSQKGTGTIMASSMSYVVNIFSE